MKKNTLLALIAAPLFAATIFASATSAQQIASKAPSAVKAGTYKVEPYHTQVSFSLSHFGFSEFSGQFAESAGSLQLDPANPAAAKLNISVKIPSVLTTVPKLTEELKGDQWFDAAKYPEATFVSTKVTKTGNDTATVAGNLTLHGVTKPVTLKAKLVGSGINPLDKSTTVGFQATGVIKRGDFGIKQYLPLVGDNVELKIDAAFVLQ